MESFFGFIKDTGKGLYEFVLYLVTMLLVLAFMVFAPVTIKPMVFLGVFFLAIAWLATGRVLTFCSILLMLGTLAHHGHLNW
tara:strand:+ start:227 stop:472 length:246 start_codon:yes stop_codon:yes gene_type:complete